MLRVPSNIIIGDRRRSGKKMTSNGHGVNEEYAIQYNRKTPDFGNHLSIDLVD